MNDQPEQTSELPPVPPAPQPVVIELKPAEMKVEAQGNG
jgi:hypothetical protein